MDNRSPNARKPGNGLIGRLEHVTQGVNAVLLVLAIGLATLDFTVYCALQVREAAPPTAAAYSVAGYSAAGYSAAAANSTGTGAGGAAQAQTAAARRR